MLGRLIQTVRAHPFLSAGIVAVVAAPAALVPLLVRLPSEISYTSHRVFSHCSRIKRLGMLCSSEYDFILGNTGSTETAVTLVWPGDLRKWAVNHRISNITADDPRPHDPDVRCSKEMTATTCRVDRLAAGALVQMQLTCRACAPAISALPESHAAEVHSEATIFQGDPRVTTFLRRIQFLSHLF